MNMRKLKVSPRLPCHSTPVIDSHSTEVYLEGLRYANRFYQTLREIFIAARTRMLTPSERAKLCSMNDDRPLIQQNLNKKRTKLIELGWLCGQRPEAKHLNLPEGLEAGWQDLVQMPMAPQVITNTARQHSNMAQMEPSETLGNTPRPQPSAPINNVRVASTRGSDMDRKPAPKKQDSVMHDPGTFSNHVDLNDGGQSEIHLFLPDLEDYDKLSANIRAKLRPSAPKARRDTGAERHVSFKLPAQEIMAPAVLGGSESPSTPDSWSGTTEATVSDQSTRSRTNGTQPASTMRSGAAKVEQADAMKQSMSSWMDEQLR